MPFQVRIHAGTVNIVACDIDGYANPAVQALGDTAVTTVNVIDSVLGGERYDTNDTVIATGTSVVQASKSNNAASDRANLTLTRVALNPAVQNAGGNSIRVGSTVVDQFSQADVTFTTGTGSPSLIVFEDFPSIIASSLASDEAFGDSAVKNRNTATPTGIASPEAFGVANIAYDIPLAAEGLASDEAIGLAAIGLLGSIGALSLASSEAFGSSTVTSITRLVATSVPSSEAFGAAIIKRIVKATSIASSEAFGSSTARIKYTLAAFGIPSPEAFGAATIGAQHFVAAVGVESDEVFGVADIITAAPPAEELPESIAPGRVMPAGAVLEGTPLVTTIGEWTGFPTAARFVWMADGDVVRDTGYQVDTWSDVYSPTSSDAGKTITVSHYAENEVGAAGPTLATGVIDVTGLPPAFVGADEVFGAMPSIADVWNAAKQTIRTWLPTYLRQRERLSGRPYGSLSAPRGWRVFTEDLDSDPGDQLPLCVIVAPGVADTLIQGAHGNLQGRLELGVSIVVASHGGADQTGTILLAGEYGAALRAMFAQHGSLGGVVDGTTLLGERYDAIASESQRTLAAAQLVISVRMSGLATRFGGPTTPFPDPAPDDDPGGPVLGVVATTELELERV